MVFRTAACLVLALAFAFPAAADTQEVNEAEALKAYRAFLVSLRGRIDVEVDGRRSDVLIRDSQEGVDDVLAFIDRYLADPAAIQDLSERRKLRAVFANAGLTFSHIRSGRASWLAGTAFRVFVSNISNRYIGVWFGAPFGLKEAYLATLEDYYGRKDAIYLGSDGQDVSAAQLRSFFNAREGRLAEAIRVEDEAIEAAKAAAVREKTDGVTEVLGRSTKDEAQAVSE